MTAFVSVIGACFVCKNDFMFSPTRVPSYRDGQGVRQPVCENCMNRVNARRVERGDLPFTIQPGAYEADEEG